MKQLLLFLCFGLAAACLVLTPQTGTAAPASGPVLAVNYYADLECDGVAVQPVANYQIQVKQVGKGTVLTLETNAQGIATENLPPGKDYSITFVSDTGPMTVTFDHFHPQFFRFNATTCKALLPVIS